MVFIIATKFDMHDSLNVFSIYISGPKVLIELWQHETLLHHVFKKLEENFSRFKYLQYHIRQIEC